MTKQWLEEIPEMLRLAARPTSIVKGQYLFHNGDRAEAVYRVLEGEVCLTRFSPGGSEVVLYRACENDFLAEASMFNTHYHCDAICTRTGNCLLLPADILRHCLANNADFAMNWIATLSGNLRHQRAAQERLSHKSLRMRVIHYLVERGQQGKLELDQPIMRWALELGASHEALYRTFAHYERTALSRIFA